MTPADYSDWIEYKRLVLAELIRLDKSMLEMSSKNEDHNKKLEQLILTIKDAVVDQIHNLNTKVDKQIEAIDKRNQEAIAKYDARLREAEDAILTIKIKAALIGGTIGCTVSGLVVIIGWTIKVLVEH